MIVVKGRGTGAVYTHFCCVAQTAGYGYSLGGVPLSKRAITRSAQLHQTAATKEPPRAYTHAARRKKLPCRYCLSWVVKLCKLLNQNLSSQETGSDERQSRWTISNLLEGRCHRKSDPGLYRSARGSILLADSILRRKNDPSSVQVFRQ